MGWPLVASYGCPFFFSASLSNEKAPPPGWVRPYGKCYARLEKFLGRKEMPNLGKLALIFLAAVVILALTPAAGRGQNVYGSLTGVVTDSSGAAIANETVEVTSEVPLLQSETQSLGQVVEQRSVTELPLNGRNPLALVGLVPGVVQQGTPSAGNSSAGNPVGANPFALGDFQIGGGMAGQSQILIDGVPTNGAYLNVVTVIPTQDAIEEFKVQTNNLGPEYGRFAGGVINLSTKSGTNSFHGSAYEFLRNKVLNANDFFANRGGVKRPPFTQNQFGANVGGPVLKNKLFFFSSYEGFRQRKGSILTTWVPTAAERTGDFSQIGSSNTTSVLTIYDPTTSGVGTNPACTSGATCR